MSPDGSIKLFADLSVKEKKEYIPIPDEQLEACENMSRRDRRQWYRDNKFKWKAKNSPTLGEK